MCTERHHRNNAVPIYKKWRVCCETILNLASTPELILISSLRGYEQRSEELTQRRNLQI